MGPKRHPAPPRSRRAAVGDRAPMVLTIAAFVACVLMVS